MGKISDFFAAWCDNNKHSNETTTVLDAYIYIIIYAKELKED